MSNELGRAARPNQVFQQVVQKGLQMNMKRTLIAVAGMVSLAAASQATIYTFDPGQYGSYRADNSQVVAGNYRLWDVTANNWSPVSLGSGDRTGVQTVDFTALVSGNVYQIKARDANVIIGSFTNTGGAPTGVAGQMTLAGTTLSFVNQTVNVVAPARWTYPSVQIWSTSWGNRFISRFMLPAGTWGGWYANLGDNNLFSIGVTAAGVVSVGSDARGIGISGGANQLVFPDNAFLQEVKWAGPAASPPAANWISLDWGTDNLPFSGNLTMNLYSGLYSFASGLSIGGGSYWTPVLSGGNEDVMFPKPTDPNYQLYTKYYVYHSATSGLDYTYAFLAPEPTTALLFGLAAAGLALRRRRG